MSEVTFELDGEEVTLKPTYLAYTRIPKLYGGFVPAIEAAAKLDPSALEVVVAHGMGLTPNGQKQMNLPEKIYNTGIAKVATPCVEFLTLLMNGGKPLEEEAKSTEGEA